MFPPPSEVLKTREGSLAERPLPLLLHALLLEERTAALELKRHQLEKRISFEEGVPVACTSNLLHETLGKFLVERGKLSESDYQRFLAESVQSGVPMGDLLVKKGAFPAYELYRQLQACLGHALLDCFRWSDARYRLVLDAPEVASPVRIKPGQLILTGVGLLPFDVVTTQLSFVDEQRFAAVPKPPHSVEELKLSPKDLRLLQALRARPTFAELVQKTGLGLEPLLRRLYAFAVLGLMDFAEAVPAPAAAPAQAGAEEARAEPTPALPSADDERLRDGLTAAFMEMRSKDPFALLGVPEDVPIVGLRKAFLALADRYAPVRFRDAELREKAEALLVAHARAFAELSNPEQLARWRSRRQPQVKPPPAKAVHDMEIKTELLDAAAQVEHGRKRLSGNDYKGALTYFEYACEIDPKGAYLAYRAWARYLLSPGQHQRLALQELQGALEVDPQCDLACFFTGEIHRAAHAFADAEAAYRRAFKVNPKERRYADLIRAMTSAKRP